VTDHFAAIVSQSGIAQIPGLAPGNAMTVLSSSSLVSPWETSLLQTEIPELLKSSTLDGQMRLYMV